MHIDCPGFESGSRFETLLENASPGRTSFGYLTKNCKRAYSFIDSRRRSSPRHDGRTRGVHPQVSKLMDMREQQTRRRQDAPHDRPDSSDQLHDLERFGQVVVGACLKRLQPVLHPIAGGQDHDSGLHLAGAQFRAHQESVLDGEGLVRYEDVESSVSGQEQGLFAIVGSGDVKARDAKICLQCLVRADLVVSQEEPQDPWKILNALASIGERHVELKRCR